MKKVVIILLIVLLMLGGCKKNNNVESNKDDVKTIDYDFKYNGKTFKLGESFNINNYDKPLDYSEASSFVFEGLDKTYKYEHFELTTYPIDGIDKLYVIQFLDDKVKTNEGIGLSDTYEDMIKAYGTDYSVEEKLHTYCDNKKCISFIIDGDIITRIEYFYSLEGTV